MALLGLSCIFLSGCFAAAPRGPMTTVHVEIDIYSGRENPGWDLGAADAELFRTRLAGLSPDTAGVLSVPDGLGYRGLHVVVSSDGIAQRFLIAAGAVIIESDTAAAGRSLRDPDRALEKWLLLTGKEHLGADQLQYLLEQF